MPRWGCILRPLAVGAFLELRDLAWGQPIVVTADRPVRVALQARDNDSIDVEIVSDDIIHCQGLAAYTGAQARAPRRGPTQISDACSSGRSKRQRRGRYTLRPELLQAVAQLLTDFAGQKVSLFSIDCVRLLFECPDNALVSIRQAASNGVDIDLCNEQGGVRAGARFAVWSC